MTSQDNETLVEHLEALRKMLIKCLLSLAIGLLPIFFVTPYVMDALIRVMMGDNAVTLNFFSPMEVFILQIKMAVVLDILLCPFCHHGYGAYGFPDVYPYGKWYVISDFGYDCFGAFVQSGLESISIDAFSLC